MKRIKKIVFLIRREGYILPPLASPAKRVLGLLILRMSLFSLRSLPVPWGLFLGILLAACDTNFPAVSYRVEFPPLPESWAAILGEPRWRISWINRDGNRETMESSGSGAVLAPLANRATPVIAYPYWPERGLGPGIMRPGGGLFPFDVREEKISLSWRGGVDAFFYLELAAAGGTQDSGPEAPPELLRRPEFFDWARWRKLFEDRRIAEKVLSDPWSADWKDISRKTVQSGFDLRRITAMPEKEFSLPRLGGQSGETRWIKSSPFETPVIQNSGEAAGFKVYGPTETFISPGGVLRCSGTDWIWLPWEYGESTM
jgi:hypothetical protein